MNDFEKLIQLHEDFACTWLAFNASRHDADDLIVSVEARLRLEREQNAARVAELERTAADSGRSETVRRVATGELAKFQKCKFAATPEEIAAFAELVREQERALLDLQKIQTEFLEAFNKAGQHLKNIRADVLGHKSLPVAPNWITGQQAKFAKLCEEV